MNASDMAKILSALHVGEEYATMVSNDPKWDQPNGPMLCRIRTHLDEMAAAADLIRKAMAASHGTAKPTDLLEEYTPRIAHRIAYEHTFTSGEWRALEWIGDRYEACKWILDKAETFVDGGAVLKLAEHEAWELRELMEAEDAGCIPCFADGGRLQEFIDSFV